MAITFFGYGRTPTADSGTNAADPTPVTPPADMVVGDLVLMYAYAQAPSLTQAVSESGGQSWAEGIQCSYTGLSARLFWCRFNGSWTANPSVSAGSTVNNTVAMLVFRPSSSFNTWEVDVAEAEADFSNPASPNYTVTISGLTLNTAGAVAVARWATYDNNTWGNLSGAGWSKSGLPDQVINLAGTNDSSMSFAYYISEADGATGDVSQDQLTNAPDGGNRDIIAFKEVAGTTVLAVANAAFTHASSAPAVTTDAATLTMSNAALTLAAAAPAVVAGSWSTDFSGISQQTSYKFEVWDGSAWVDLTSLGGKNYLKPGTTVTAGGRGISAEPMAGTWSAEIYNEDGIFHPSHPTSTYKTLLRVGRKVRISLGRVTGGTAVYWQRLIGYMDAPQFNHGTRTVSLSGSDYTKNLKDTTLRHPGNYFGTLIKLDSVSSSGVTGAELYDQADAFAVSADETNDVAGGWADTNVTITSVADGGGGSTYVGRIVRGATAGSAYAHNADIATVQQGVLYQISLKAKYVVGSQYATMQLYQTIGGALRLVGSKKTIAGADYTETKYTFTPKMTGALECRFSFAETSSAENDEMRIDAISVKTAAPTWYQYPLPQTNNNGPYYVTLDGIPCYSGADSEDHTNWHYDEATKYFYFDVNRMVSDGTQNLWIYYYTDQTPEGVVARLLAKSGLYGTYTTEAELDILTATALADMDYTPTGITLRRVWFDRDAGSTAFTAIAKVCERCNYRFWFTAEGVPCFKPAPEVGEITFAFGEFDDLRDAQDYQALEEIKNRVTIEGAEQDIFNVTDRRASSRLKGEASDATSIAAYLEKTHAITNQLFEDQGSLDDMCATLLAAAKDPKLYSTLTLFGNVVPLEVGQTIRWRVMLGANAVDTLGVIRSISFSGKNATYKVENVSASTSAASQTLVVRNAAFTAAAGPLSLINIDAATVLGVSAADFTLAATAPAVAAGPETDLYAEADAMAKVGEANDINPHWAEVNAMLVSTPDAGGGSTYVGLMIGGAGGGTSYIHSAHVADLVSGVAYTIALDYKYSLGTKYVTLRFYQLVGSTMTQIGTARTLLSTTWTALSIPLTAVATAPLQMRFTFPAIPSEEGDELRVDDISIKVAS